MPRWSTSGAHPASPWSPRSDVRTAPASGIRRGSRSPGARDPRPWERAARPARPEVAAPAPQGEDGADHRRQPARLDDLAPPGPERDAALGEGDEVAVEVGLPVGRPLVPQPAVQLDERVVVGVLDVAPDPAVRAGRRRLPVTGRQAVRPLDVAQVAPLQG